MKIKILYFILLLSVGLAAQEITLPIGKSGKQTFGGKLFLFGLQQADKSLSVKIYALKEKLQADSISVDLKGRAEDYLKLYSDTLHGFLNIYIQKQNSRSVKIVRINKKFSIHNVIDEVDITRLNSIAFFEKEILYSGKDVYTIKSSISDSTGTQFYLNKWSLKSDKENFEYEAKWQFPFERKNISGAQLAMANKRHVFALVNIDKGLKKGQWYLKIDAQEGRLVKAQKLNNKGDTSAYLTHKIKIDSASSSHILFGQKFSAVEYDVLQNKLNLSGKKQCSFFLTVIDSSMEVLSKNEFKVPVVDVSTQAKKLPSGYLPKTSAIKYATGEGYKIELDIFKSLNSNAACFRYSNSVSLSILEKEGVFQFQKNSITPNAAIDQYYSGADAADVSGLICNDSLNNLFRLMFQPMPLNSKVAVKRDPSGNLIWLLTKTDLKKNIVTLSILAPEKKVYKLKSIAEIERSAEPFVELITEKEFIAGKIKDGDKLLLQLLTW